MCRDTICAASRSITAVQDRVAQVRPIVSARHQHQPATKRRRRRERIVDNRDQCRRLADTDRLRFPALRRSDPARPCRANLDHGFPGGLDLLAACSGHDCAILEGALAVRDLHHLSAFSAADSDARRMRRCIRAWKSFKRSGLPPCSACRGGNPILAILWSVLKYTESATYLLTCCRTRSGPGNTRIASDRSGTSASIVFRHLARVARTSDAEEIVIVSQFGISPGAEIVARALNLNPALGQRGPRVPC